MPSPSGCCSSPPAGRSCPPRTSRRPPQPVGRWATRTPGSSGCSPARRCARRAPCGPATSARWRGRALSSGTSTRRSSPTSAACWRPGPTPSMPRLSRCSCGRWQLPSASRPARPRPSAMPSPGRGSRRRPPCRSSMPRSSGSSRTTAPRPGPGCLRTPGCLRRRGARGSGATARRRTPHPGAATPLQRSRTCSAGRASRASSSSSQRTAKSLCGSRASPRRRTRSRWRCTTVRCAPPRSPGGRLARCSSGGGCSRPAGGGWRPSTRRSGTAR
mmetsp:Transcript_24246/g.57768  ORF Transcript_24246/g.57768 Transcript_24246/m.57768 type:complete len:273 (-) Transcript_24246:487-1305(-)